MNIDIHKFVEKISDKTGIDLDDVVKIANEFKKIMNEKMYEESEDTSCTYEETDTITGHKDADVIENTYAKEHPYQDWDTKQ